MDTPQIAPALPDWFWEQEAFHELYVQRVAQAFRVPPEYIYTKETTVGENMKVLKSGTGQKGWSLKTKCSGFGNGGGGCGAILLVEENDLYLTYSSHYDGSNETYVTFKCPECSVETDVAPGRVPSRIIQKIKGEIEK